MEKQIVFVDEKNSRFSFSSKTIGKLKAAGVLVSVGSIGLVLRQFNPENFSFSICPIKIVSGLDCPLCGGTRATHFFLRGDFVAAFEYNAFVASLMIPTLIFFVCWSAVSLWKKNRWDVPTTSYFFLFLLVVFGVVRNLPFSWAEPLRTY